MKIVKHKIIKKTSILIASAIILLGFGFGWWYFSTSSKNSFNTKKVITSNNKTVTQVAKPSFKIHMSAMGDMLAHDTIIANAKTGDGYDFGKYFSNIKNSYKGSDIVFCNQEGLSSGEAFGISGYPSFNAPIQFSAGLQSGAGCNLINLANNHMGDKGTAAIDATLDNWSNLKPLAVSGANKSQSDQEKVSYVTVNGLKIGYLSFADFNNSQTIPSYAVNTYHNEALVRRLVTLARQNADVVIVSMHWGVEDSNTVSDDQLAEANLLNQLGVDVVIGTGPHVLQMMQTVYRASDNFKTYVWYSLGNMLSSQLQTKELIGGIAQFDISKSTDGKILVDKLSFTPTYMHYEWTAGQSANGDLLARKNAMIYLLDSAADPLSRSLLNTTVAAQKQYVTDTLGSEVEIR